MDFSAKSGSVKTTKNLKLLKNSKITSYSDSIIYETLKLAYCRSSIA